MYNKLIYFISFLLLMFACSPKEVMYLQNVDYNYLSESAIYHDLRKENDSLRIYLKFADENLFKNIPASELKLSYLINKSYEQPEIIKRDTVPNFAKRLRITDSYATVDFKIALASLTLPLVLQFQIQHHPGDDDVLWLDIPLTKESTSRNFILTDADGQPLFRNHVNTAEVFLIKAYKPNEAAEIKKYEASFPAALPPFSLNQKQVAPTLKLISSQQISSADSLQLAEEGLYVLEMNNASLTVVAEGNSYPELTTARELIEPLIYVTSAKERENLYSASDPKRALDQFWLDVANQDKTLAKQLIKIYYDRVKEANLFFNSHKAGWLTDRGMIYIVFGKPDIVNRRQNAEEWTYSRRTRGGAVLKFNFIKKPNTFTQNHYELLRHPDYEFVWYSTVEKWRKGITQEE